jgi:DNA repair protein RadC
MEGHPELAMTQPLHAREAFTSTTLSRLLDALGDARDLADADLVDLLVPSSPHAPVGAEILDALGGPRGLLAAGLPELRRAGLSPHQAARILAAAELARRSMRPPSPAPVVRGPQDVHALVAPQLAGLDHERLLIVCLDAKNRVLAARLASVGTAKATIVDPATVFRLALRAGAAAVIVAHNHPSGDPTPSRDDEESTRALMQAGILLRVPVLDHVVVAGDTYRSMAATVMGRAPYPVRGAA